MSPREGNLCMLIIYFHGHRAKPLTGLLTGLLTGRDRRAPKGRPTRTSPPEAHCAKRAAYPDLPPRGPLPESLAAQAAYTEALLYCEYGDPSSPTGTAAAECPGEEEPPAWEAPAAQISQRAPSPQGRGRLTTPTWFSAGHLCPSLGDCVRGVP